MCQHVFRRNPCGHEVDLGHKTCPDYDPAKHTAGHCGSIDFTPVPSLLEPDDPDCERPGCRFLEYEGRWRCCRCLQAPNTTSNCARKLPWARTETCGHAFCKQCLPAKNSIEALESQAVE
ncbi:hypothetical protein S40288_00521 [Stachybotrys chartarum IBT 40288]|nr:hypothetical protein S40288_00521 [Stachybotrys chartarum IBT 40288]